jgi:VanZ family protein
MVGVLFLSTRVLTGIPIPLFKGSDKIIHFVFYAILVALLSFGYIKSDRFNLSKLLFSAYWSILFGGLIELIQHYIVEGRSGEWEDFLANTIGIFFSSYLLYRRYLKK